MSGYISIEITSQEEERFKPLYEEYCQLCLAHNKETPIFEDWFRSMLTYGCDIHIEKNAKAFNHALSIKPIQK